LKFNLGAVRKLIPYIKLVERERLRVPSKSEAVYKRFFESDEVDALFNELFLDKLTISRIMLLLGERPLFNGRDLRETGSESVRSIEAPESFIAAGIDQIRPGR
jgi:hypothetical protein